MIKKMPVRITPSDIVSGSVVRHKKCVLMSEKGPRCSVCQIYRSDLNALSSQMKVREERAPLISASSCIPNTRLSRRQLEEKAGLLQSERQSLKRRADHLQDKVSAMMRESVDVDSRQDEFLRASVNTCGEEMEEVLGKDPLAHLLWQQQKEALLKGKQVRWHPAVIRWCVAIQSKSSAAYKLIRQSGFMRLPHHSTLHSYTHFTDPTTGFNLNMLHRIVADYKIGDRAEFESNVCLLFDEMKIKAGLVFSMKSGRVVGFTDVGSVGNELANFERRCRGDKEPDIATHVLVLMVRGIFSALHAPVGYYPTTGVTSHQLFPCIWEAVLYLEVVGFRVRAFVSDGASPNRKFYRLHEGGSEVSYSTFNPFDNSRKVFFVCDVPHLMKTTRNNFENSGFHNKTKALCVSFML
jgi:hypothetical protein